MISEDYCGCGDNDADANDADEDFFSHCFDGGGCFLNSVFYVCSLCKMNSLQGNKGSIQS